MLVETTRYHHPNIISQTVANKINSVANLDEFKSLMLELLNEAIFQLVNYTSSSVYGVLIVISS